MFNLFETEFICSLIIFVYFNNPIGRKKVVIISIFKMVLIYYNNKWRYRPITRIDALNHSDLFPIVRLYNFNFPISIIQCYNKCGYNLAYKKIYFIEVLDIGLYNTIFNNYILKKSKPNPDDL